MTLELCNWVVHMGNWYKVLKGWGVRPRRGSGLYGYLSVPSERQSSGNRLSTPPGHLLSWCA